MVHFEESHYSARPGRRGDQSRNAEDRGMLPHLPAPSETDRQTDRQRKGQSLGNTVLFHKLFYCEYKHLSYKHYNSVYVCVCVWALCVKGAVGVA